MRAVLAILVAFVIVAALLLWRALNAMCQKEIETRIGRLPNALIHLAVLRLPRDVRGDLTSEWAAELDFIVSGAEGLPVTRLLRGLRFAASLLHVAPSVAHELTCTCTRRSRLGTIAWTTWSMLFSAGAGAGAIVAFDSLTRSHHTAAGISTAAFALACLILRKPLWVSIQARIEVHGEIRFGIGYLALGAFALIQGGGWWVASGAFLVVCATVVILGFWWLNRLSVEESETLRARLRRT